MILSKKINRLVAAVLTLISASLFFTASVSAAEAQIEPLHGLQVTDTYVTILVTSNGCTQKDDFISVLQKTEPPVVTFIRLKPDYCKAAPRLLPIQFALKEVGAQTFKVNNILTPGPNF